MTVKAPLVHEECWLLLPWLANGRLAPAERSRVEQHVSECPGCAREVAWQRVACQAFAEPDRVSYAPGPSFRKLMERIDGRQTGKDSRPRLRGRPLSARQTLWRPPGLAWAAAFVLAVALGALAPLAYRWSQPLYATYTAASTGTPDVLHVAFKRSLTIGEVEELLRSTGARVVEGPGSSGIFGVAPVAGAAHRAAGSTVSPQMRALAARLQSDPRVRWVEPLAADDGLGGAQQPRVPSR
jgi:Putative zinc-finger